MLVTVVLLLASAGLIYLSCEAFTNSVEWLGKKLAINQTAIGSILAAFGTALPESVVTLTATAFGGTEARQGIGIGAVLGGPLALSTLAYAIVGLSLVVYGRQLGRGSHPRLMVDGLRLSRDQLWFLLIFVVKIGLGLVIWSLKPWCGILFLAAYAGYFHSEMSGKGGGCETSGPLEPLLLRRGQDNPALGWVLLQTLGTMGVIFVASNLFVTQLEAVAPWLGLSPQLTALLLSPLATELPEVMNAVIWVRQGKEHLALANISGSMMIQATIPTAFGLFFTPWLLDRSLLIAAGITALAVVSLFFAFRRGRVSGVALTRVGWLYGLFCIMVAIMP